MSQIVSAFAVPPGSLPGVQRRLSAGDWPGFWGDLRAFAVGPDLPYSGYVLVVLAEYLREAGLELPVSRDPAVRLLVERCAPLVCALRPDAAAAAAALEQMAVSPTAGAAYWRDFTGDEELEAGTAVQAGLDWLRQALQVGGADHWCLILAG